MSKILLTLFLSLFKVTYGSSGENDKETSLNILPLILIKYENSCVNPLTITKTTWSKDGQTLSGGTLFTSSPQGEQIIMCARQNTSSIQDIKHNTKKSSNLDDLYCTYPTIIQESEPLRCNHSPQPYLEAINLGNDPNLIEELRCGRDKHGKMYWVVYKLCFPNEQPPDEAQAKLVNPNAESSTKEYMDFEIYRFCFDEQKNEILYTSHIIMSPDLLSDDTLKSEKEKIYDMTTEGYNRFSSYIQMMQQQFTELEKLSIDGNHPTSSSSLYPYKMQQLVPEDDLAFALWRKPTFHYLNVKPMPKIQSELWDHISHLIRKNAINLNRQYDIFTTAFTVSRLHNMINSGKLPQIPDIWIKVVNYYRINLKTDKIFYEAVAIVMNSNRGNTETDLYFQNTFSDNLCENIFIKKFPDIGTTVRRCSVTTEIQQLFDITLSIDGILSIDLSIDDENQLGNEINDKGIDEENDL